MFFFGRVGLGWVGLGWVGGWVGESDSGGGFAWRVC